VGNHLSWLSQPIPSPRKCEKAVFAAPPISARRRKGVRKLISDVARQPTPEVGAGQVVWWGSNDQRALQFFERVLTP